MWHEARRRERATQKLFSDHKKRAEKRREENKVDPSSLLQVHGVKSKINMDPATHKLAANSMVVWQGDQKTTIDRFDVRATLSSLPTEERPPGKQTDKNDHEKRRKVTILDANENEYMKKLLNFERYCLIMQNDLKKVSESTRLGLVDKKNALLSEAKMRKLQNNWFGTSGEASISGDHSASNNHNSISRSQGVSIGFDYNVQSADADDDLPVQINTADAVPDLDDCETELDLDFVMKLQPSSANVNEVIGRYGLNCDEFNILVDSTSRSAKEILHKLKQVKSEVKRGCDTGSLPYVPKQQGFYGPALPPDMQKKRNISPSSHSSGNASPVRQSSPSGADLPIKPRDSNTSRDDSPQPTTDHGSGSQQTKETTSKVTRSRLGSPKQSETSKESSQNISSLSSSAHSSQKQPSMTSELKATALTNRPIPIQINLKTNTETEKRCSVPHDTTRRERRAVTPLAYKRYCRSSRSLSRERITSGDYKSRSSSSSSSGSSTSSSSSGSTRSRTSSSSLTDSSYDSRSRSGSRRRRRVRSRSRTRSRSPRYRHSGRNGHRYRERERR